MQQEHDKNRLTRRDAHRGEGNGHGFHYPECLTKP